MSKPVMIHFDAHELALLKAKYAKAKNEDRESFEFRGTCS